jgi:organic hydroperoxide reductase OsmC/OhrA
MEADMSEKTSRAAAVAEERTHHATLRLIRGYEFAATFDDLPEAAPILFDEPPPLGDNAAPNAAAVLGAAVGNCLSASFTFCLRKARLEPRALTARVTTHVVRNESGRFRIQGIDVEISPEFSGDDLPKFERCGQLFEDFCTVTASIRKGIPVHVTLKETAGAPS